MYLGRRHRLEPSIIQHSISPPIIVHRERKHSVSSRSSRSSEIRHRRKVETTSPHSDYQRQPPFSPQYVDELETERRKKKKRDKRHKKEKKLKKKKKKSKHRSRSTSFESNESDSDKSEKNLSPKLSDERDNLSDWEQDTILKTTKVIIDTSACSPVSNDSHIASPEILDEKTPSPIPETPPPKNYDYVPSSRDYKHRESPHTPPPHPTKSNHYADETIRIRTLESPIDEQRLTPVKSPYRNPSPEHSHSRSGGGGMSPNRRRKLERDSIHRKCRKNKDRSRSKRTRSRSPVRKRSKSPSYSRRHYSSPSPSRSSRIKRYRTSPRRERERLSPR